jgi:hypothetical protein
MGSVTAALERVATPLVVAGAVASWVALLFLGRGLTFYADEWSYLAVPGLFGSLNNLFEPHNEHWATLSLVVYRSIFAVVGLSTYLPYLAVLLALHALAAGALFVLVRRAAGPLVALGATALVLWAGSGWQNLFWAFQIGFVGATAAGLWALVAFTSSGRRAPVVGMLLLLGAVMTSGIGLVFVAVVGAALVADPGRRRRLAWLAPVVAAYAAWFVVVGRIGIARHRDPFTLEALADVPGFVWSGVVASVEATVGPLPVVAPLLAALFLIACLAGLASRRVDPLLVAGVGGLVVLYGLIGLTRAQLGLDQATRSRYLYEGVVLVVLAAGGFIATVRTWPRSSAGVGRVALGTGLAVLFASGLVSNVMWLADGRQHMLDRAVDTRAWLTRVEAGARTDSDARPPQPGLPEPDVVRRLLAEHGDPRQDVLAP